MHSLPSHECGWICVSVLTQPGLADLYIFSLINSNIYKKNGWTSFRSCQGMSLTASRWHWKTNTVQFGFYVFFPVGVMLYFGGPEFYDNYVKGIKFWPDINTTYVRCCRQQLQARIRLTHLLHRNLLPLQKK